FGIPEYGLNIRGVGVVDGTPHLFGRQLHRGSVAPSHPQRAAAADFGSLDAIAFVYWNLIRMKVGTVGPPCPDSGVAFRGRSLQFQPVRVQSLTLPAWPPGHVDLRSRDHDRRQIEGPSRHRALHASAIL